MADRILVWHLDRLNGDSRQGPTYYLDRDYEPVAVRIYATIAPKDGELVIDIKDDGSSIFTSIVNKVTTTTRTDSRIEYHSLATSTFQVNETITGATSGATGKVLSDNKLGSMTAEHTSLGTNFSVGETITGATSTATALVDSWIRGTRKESLSSVPITSGAMLAKGENSTEIAEDFNPDLDCLEEGSWVSLHVVQSKGAKGITVQLELDTV